MEEEEEEEGKVVMVEGEGEVARSLPSPRNGARGFWCMPSWRRY